MIQQSRLIIRYVSRVTSLLQTSLTLTKICHASASTSYKQNIQLKAYRIPFISNLFHIQDDEASELTERYPVLLTINDEKMSAITDLLTNSNISLDVIRKYPLVLTRAHGTLSMRLKLLKDAGIDQVTMRMLHCSNLKFDKLLWDIEKSKAALGSHASEADALANLLDCCSVHMRQVLENNESIQNSKLSTLKPKIELLLSHGVAASEILSKIWILGYSQNLLVHRINIMKSQGITPQNCRVYLNLLKCRDFSFKRAIEKWGVEQEVYDSFGSKVNYLASKLNCSMKDVDMMVAKYPKLDRISLYKLKHVIDFLIGECKLDPSDVQQYPMVLNFSVKTLTSRFDELSTIQNSPVSVKLLQLDARVYNKYIRNIT